MSYKIVFATSFSAFLLLGVILAQELNSEDILKRVQDEFQNGIQNGTQEQLDKAYNALQEKCRKVAGDNWEEPYNVIVKAKDTLQECATSYVNITELQSKLEVARRHGKIDEVFKDYCQRKLVLQNCLSNFTATLRPCLRDTERDNLKIVHNITDQLASFICHKDGDRIALFIAEKGPECFNNNTEAIQECVRGDPLNKHLATTAFDDSTNVTAIQELVFDNLEFDTEACRRMDEVQDCVVRKLKTCNEPTPFNIAESLYKFIRKSTPCNQHPLVTDARTSPNAASSLRVGLAVVTSTLVALMIASVA